MMRASRRQAGVWLAALLLGSCGLGGSAVDDRTKAAFSDPAAQAFIADVKAGRINDALAKGSRLPGGLNSVGNDGETAVLAAVTANQPKMLEALLKAGANPNGAQKRAPIVPAARDASGRLIDLLLAAGADPNGLMGDETALNQAARVGDRGNIDRLLRGGANIELGRIDNNSPAGTAASGGEWIIATYLFERGASPWYTSPYGFTIAQSAQVSRLLPTTPEGQARDAIIAKYKAAGYPWPPPNPEQVRQLMAAGQWPPKLTPPQR